MQTVLRAAFVYFFLLVAFRVMGKRELSEMSPFELVTLMIIPETFSQAVVSEDFSMTNALLACTTFLALVFVTSLLSHRYKGVERLVEGQSTLLVRHGAFLDGPMNRQRILPDEVFSEMHRVGIERLEDVKWAILEDDGEISIVPFAPGAPQPPPARSRPV